MSRYHSYLSTAVAILEDYQGEEPFVHFLRKKFATNKKYGSRDRKIISGLCYHYFRTAIAFPGEKREEKILRGIFLCETEQSPVLEVLRPAWNQKINLDTAGKLDFLSVGLLDIFPFHDELGEPINKKQFAQSFLVQPDLFIRLRPGFESKVKSALQNAVIKFEEKNNDCLALANSTNLEKLVRLNKEVIVQDLNSQKVLDTILQETTFDNKRPDAWDCCAASGGKSILLYDRLSRQVKLTVSDIRSSILSNLKKRLQEAGIPLYNSFIADLTQQVPEDLGGFDIIICDAPCTGSGTWSRTPEQLYFFKKEMISSYSQKQKKIAEAAAGQLKAKGLFIYITCSVFKKENEEVVDYLLQQRTLELVNKNYLQGYGEKADSMFVAVFRSRTTA